MILNRMLAAIALFTLTACGGSADRKVPELAGEMCDCFTSMNSTLTADGKALMKEVSSSASPQVTLQLGIKKLKPEDAVKFAEQLQEIGQKGSPVFTCMENFDKKHGKETTKDKNALAKKLLKEMQSKTDCPVGAAVVNMGIAKGVIN